jgi:predicted acylesterase/phospholipase RssA
MEPTCLVISGGGINGTYFLGALQHLYEKDVLKNINMYVGTSIGALIGTLLSIGFTPQKIFDRLLNFDTKSILQTFNINDFINKKGLFSINPFFKYVEDSVLEELGYSPTFEDVRKRFGKKLIIVATNKTKKQPTYFSHKTHPTMSIIKAAKYSCSIPIIFHKLTFEGDDMVDGAMVSNFPLSYVDNNSRKILGLMLKVDHDEDDTDENDNSTTKKIMEFISYVKSILLIPLIYTESSCRDSASDKCNILTIHPSKNLSIKFNIDNKQKKDMFDEGREQGVRFYNLKYGSKEEKEYQIWNDKYEEISFK